MSGLKIDEIQKPITLSVEKPIVVSSYGPSAVLREKIMADTWTEAGFSLEFKSVSPNSLILAKEVVVHQPVILKFRPTVGNQSRPMNITYGNCGDDAPIAVNGFFSETLAHQIQPNLAAAGKIFAGFTQNNVTKRPMGFLSSWTSCVLTINGTSFSSRVQQSLGGMKKLFTETRYDAMEGAYERAPYTNIASAKYTGYTQKGIQERCRKDLKPLYATYGTKNGEELPLADIQYEAVLTTRIPVGPFFYSCFPRAYNIAGGRVDCLPHVTDFQLEVQYDSVNPLIHWFCTSTTDPGHPSYCPGHTDRRQGQPLVSSSGGQTANCFIAPNGRQDDMLTSGIDWDRLWQARKVADLDYIPTGDTTLCCLKRPYLTVMHIQPPSWSALQPVYSIPSMRLQCYSIDCDVEASKTEFPVRFPYIKLDQISALYVIWVEDSMRGNGARQPRMKNRADNQSLLFEECPKEGAAWQNLFCPIKWDTIRISASVKNSVLGNLPANRATTMDMFRVYKTFAGDPDMCFEDWIKYNQMLVFNAQQLGTDVGFGSAFSTITLSVDFIAEKPYSDYAINPQRIFRCNTDPTLAGQPIVSYGTATGSTVEVGKRVNRELPRRYTARMLMLEPELIALAENSCAVEQIRLQGQAVQQSLISGASLVVSDKIDDLEQYAS